MVWTADAVFTVDSGRYTADGAFVSPYWTADETFTVDSYRHLADGTVVSYWTADATFTVDSLRYLADGTILPYVVPPSSGGGGGGGGYGLDSVAVIYRGRQEDDMMELVEVLSIMLGAVKWLR